MGQKEFHLGVDETVVEGELLARLVHLGSRDEPAVVRLLCGLAPVHWRVAERNEVLVTSAIAGPPTRGEQQRVRVHKLISGEAEFFRKQRLHDGLELVVELGEGAPHPDTEVVSVLAARSPEHLAHLRISEVPRVSELVQTGNGT